MSEKPTALDIGRASVARSLLERLDEEFWAKQPQPSRERLLIDLRQFLIGVLREGERRLEPLSTATAKKDEPVF